MSVMDTLGTVIANVRAAGASSRDPDTAIGARSHIDRSKHFALE